MIKLSLLSLLILVVFSFSGFKKSSDAKPILGNPSTSPDTFIDYLVENTTLGEKNKQTTLRYGKPEDVGLISKELTKIDDILRNAVRDSVFPGAVAAVVKDGVMVYRKEMGYHDYQKNKKVKDSDIFDLASITKVVSTTTAVMKLIDDEKLALDDEVWKFIPEFDTDSKRQITIRDMLLTYQPRTKYVYSDLGMILLAEIVSIVAEERIDSFMRNEFYYPMGMNDTYFNPKQVSQSYVDRVPPTEIDTVYRKKLIQAEVHDERAYYMDGVAGHAGLFATAEDLAKYATLILNTGVYDDKRYLSPEIIHKFTSQQSDISRRGLGFDRKSPTGFTTAGQLASNDTFGHLGFTGTSLWIDREKNMAVILLTNRTFPYRSYGTQISKIRAAVADAAFSALITSK